jgi:hypothetical protein
VITSGHRKSFQLKVKWKMPSVASAGRLSGSVIFRKM